MLLDLKLLTLGQYARNLLLPQQLIQMRLRHRNLCHPVNVLGIFQYLRLKMFLTNFVETTPQKEICWSIQLEMKAPRLHLEDAAVQEPLMLHHQLIIVTVPEWINKLVSIQYIIISYYLANQNKLIQKLKITQIKKFIYLYPSRSLILDDIYYEDGTLAMDIRSIVEDRKE